MTTRNQKLQKLKYLLTKAKLTTDEQDYVTNKIKECEQLVILHNADEIKNVFDDETALPMMSRIMLVEVASFIEGYVTKIGSYDGLENISDEDWDRHVNRRAVLPATTNTQGTLSTTAPASLSTAAKTNMKLSDFPTFNGKMAQWSTFHTEFTSAARIYKMGDLLKEDINHNNKFTTDNDYKEKCEVLYNLLNRACARGRTL